MSKTMTNNEIFRKIHEECSLRALSRKTEHEYLQRFRAFIRFYKNRSATEMGERAIRKFLLHLTETGRMSSTINTYNSALRFVFGAILDKNLNYQQIPRKRIHRELPIIMSKTELNKFFSVIDNLRDKAVFETVYGGGRSAAFRNCETASSGH